jgi:galactose oxidase
MLRVIMKSFTLFATRLVAPALASALFSTVAIAQIAITNKADPLVSGLSVSASAPTQGMWSNLKGWPLIGMHSALMPSGVVLTFGSPLGKGVQDGRTFDLWDPALGLDDPAAHYTLPNAQSIDSFCSAGMLLLSGSMLISGGSSTASGLSSMASTVFNPASATPTALAAQMSAKRWYASMITLPDGRALVAGGSAPYATEAYNDVAGSLARGDISMTPEVYTPGGGWTKLTGATSRDAFGPDFNRWWYPRMWVGPNGNVFGISAEKGWSLSASGTGSITTLGTFKTSYSAATKPNIGPTSTAVMYDVGRILQVGGNGPTNAAPLPASAAATVFDIRGSTPLVIEQAPMAYPRHWASATVLPTGLVAVTGGSRFGDNGGADAVLPAELWNPSTGRWQTGASGAVYRGYHSSAMLLPNGTVLVTGGGVPGPVTNINAEVYFPPYLFKTVNGVATLAPRPIVASVNAKNFGYGSTLAATMASSQIIARASIVGLSSNTHSFNSGQRYIPATVIQSGTSVSVTMPSSPNIAPPGYYMVFLIDQSGVPSQGYIISLGGAAAPSASPAGAGQLSVDIGPRSKRVSRGRDGTTVFLNADGGTLWRMAGDNLAVKMTAPVAMTDVAVVSASSIYAVGTDKVIYRYNGSTWRSVGQPAKTIAAAEDGTVVATSTDDSIWIKNADDDLVAWTAVPGKALRVSPMNRDVLWIVGVNNNVFRKARTSSWVNVGANANDIATSADGQILLSTRTGNALALKVGDNTTPQWTPIPGTAVSVAIARGGRIIGVKPDGTLFRR